MINNMHSITEQSFLHSLSKDIKVQKEILAYSNNKFVLEDNNIIHFNKDIKDDPFVADWFTYAVEAKKIGVPQTLKNYIVQLNFPIKEGISQTEYYRQATLQGKKTSIIPEAKGIILKEPQKMELKVYKSIAGHIPVLIVPNRFDFLSIIQALCHKNEPAKIPDSMGAAMIKGVNNWSKIQMLKNNFILNNPTQNWAHHFKNNVIPNKDLYQDKIIVLSDILYSGIPADCVDIDVNKWKEISLQIRLEHECAHYFTLRKFGVMTNSMHDELIADYAGICASYGAFNIEWFLKFIGLENYPTYRSGGRLENYLGTPKLSKEAFEVLKEIVYKAAHNIYKFDLKIKNKRDIEVQKNILTSLCLTNILKMAKEDGAEILYSTFFRLINKKTQNEYTF